MKYFCFLLLLLSLYFRTAQCQNKIQIGKSEFKQTSENFSIAWKNIESGNYLMTKGKEFYHIALEYYLKAYAYNGNSAELNYLMGICYYSKLDIENSLKFLKKAYEINNYVSDDIHFIMGCNYHISSDYTSAINHYKINKEILSKIDNEKLNKDIIQLQNALNKRIKECYHAIKLNKRKKNVHLSLLTKNINNKSDQIYPIFDKNQEDLYFINRKKSRHLNLNSDKIITKEYLFQCTDFQNSWNEAEQINAETTSSPYDIMYNEKNIFLFKDNKTGKLYLTQKFLKKKKYEKLSIHSFFGGPISISNDFNCIFYSSNTEEDNSGKKDIYCRTIGAKDELSAPLNLGLNINTKYDESYPFISPDGNTLFFSSKGHNTMGGYDIFVSKRKSNNTWSKALNIGSSINSPAHDINFCLSEDEKTALFSSNRINGIGGYDLYSILLNNTQQDVIEKKLAQKTKKKQFRTKKETQPTNQNPLIKEITTKAPSTIQTIYKIQIFASSRLLSKFELDSIYSGKHPINHNLINGIYKYTIGSFTMYDAASKLKTELNIKGSFIIKQEVKNKNVTSK